MIVLGLFDVRLRNYNSNCTNKAFLLVYGVLKCQEFSIFSGFAYDLIYCQFLFYLTRAKFGKQCVIIFVIGFGGANSKLAIIIVYLILIRIFDGIKITFIKNFFGENGF